MSFDDRYFSAYAQSADQWLDGYRRRRYFYRCVARMLTRAAAPIGSVAELGCGLGMMSYHLLQADPTLRLDALDVSEYAVGVAAAQLSRYPNATVKVGDAQATGLPSAAYDAVVSLDVLEHLPRPEDLLAESARLLRPGGLLVVSTPNPESVGARTKRRRYGGVELRRVPPERRWFADRDETHINIRPIDDWRVALRGAGFAALVEGTDFLWDTPYIGGVPVILQKLLLNGGQRLLVPRFAPLPWRGGENYIGVWRKA